MLRAIVYTSNTGYTAKYAALLGKRTGLPVFSLDEAGTGVKPGAEILYLGWLMAGGVKGYKAAAKKYAVRVVCGVGMGATGSQNDDVRTKNAIAKDVPVFTLQGGFDMNKLRGVYRFMMTIMAKTAGKSLAKKQNRTPDEDGMLKLLTHGGDCVSEENLRDVLAWCKGEMNK